MDELLRDFITETGEHLAEAEAQLVRFERAPGDASLIASIFRLVHTIKGTSGFLGLNALMNVAHVAETLLGRMRDGVPPTAAAVSLVLQSIDRIRAILSAIDADGREPPGIGDDVVAAINVHLAGEAAPHVARPAALPEPAPLSEPPSQAPATASQAVLPSVMPEPVPAAAPTSVPEPAALPAAGAAPQPAARGPGAGPGAEFIRVAVTVLEGIMQLASELVLARNQLHELTRYTENEGLKLAQQRISGLTSDLCLTTRATAFISAFWKTSSSPNTSTSAPRPRRASREPPFPTLNTRYGALIRASFAGFHETSTLCMTMPESPSRCLA